MSPISMAIYRMVTDVVLKSDLRQYLKLPAIAGGRRQIVAAPASEAFLGYQRHLAERIKAIEQRQRKPQKGDDILLSVITDGRHAAIDLRFVRSGSGNDPDNKLNALIDKVFTIWEQTANNRYTRSDGVPYALPGAAQMIFSDLGTLAAEETRGFSAYRWIKDSLVARGVPASQIAFMQDHKKSSAKQRLFNAVNGGQVRVLIGSSETMGTGVNAQRRLKALHHLDVPWLPSQIEQREGRIERQGNENEEIELYAYATKRSVDATGWQILERKARFIDAAMSGDRSVRRIEDAGSQANQFALAKAIASGDERLMRKAGIASEIARLERLRDSHFDDQFAIRRRIGSGEKQLEDATRRSARDHAGPRPKNPDPRRRLHNDGRRAAIHRAQSGGPGADRLHPQDEAAKAGLDRADRGDRRLRDPREDHLLRRHRAPIRPRAQVIRRHRLRKGRDPARPRLPPRIGARPLRGRARRGAPHRHRSLQLAAGLQGPPRRRLSA